MRTLLDRWRLDRKNKHEEEVMKTNNTVVSIKGAESKGEAAEFFKIKKKGLRWKLLLFLMLWSWGSMIMRKHAVSPKGF